MKLDKFDYWFIFVSIVTSILIGVYSKFDLYFANNDAIIMAKGWYQFLKHIFIAIPIGGCLAFLIIYIKKIVIGQSSILKTITEAKIKLEETKNEFVKNIEVLHNVIINDQKEAISTFFQNKPFNYFLETNNHTGVIGSLIEISLKTGFNKLTGISSTKYLELIQEAIKNTKSFCGVNIYSIRWFINGNGVVPKKDVDLFNKYFMDNRNTISPKRRIFVLSNSNGEIQKMESDLKDSKLLDQFFDISSGIQTFWISEEELIKEMEKHPEFNSIKTPVFDFGIYDNLIIKYNYSSNELDYKKITESDDEMTIYKFFEQCISVYKKFDPFKPIFLFEDKNSCFYDYRDPAMQDFEQFYNSNEWTDRIVDTRFIERFIH
ncbi:MAG: hypothetical protein IH597_01525 [Bacteroidales bacterium]|nr:hypothetical protein [Bacteroidales bacterium]